MTTARSWRTASSFHGDHSGRRLLAAYLLSLLLHGLLLIGVTGGWQRSPRLEPQPVYFVDLVHTPVLNPQAGRPEPRVSPPKATNVPAKAAVPVKASPAKVAPATRAPAKTAERQVADALQKLRDERALQEKFAAMRQSQAVPVDVPVGLPDAKGNEAGITSLVYVQATLQQNWALSPYTLAEPARMARIEAWVRITYGKSGRLESFRFERASEDAQFDESIKRALIKSQQLEQSLPVRLEDVRVVFNLKTMKALTEARR
jgi:hypothetical protein